MRPSVISTTSRRRLNVAAAALVLLTAACASSGSGDGTPSTPIRSTSGSTAGPTTTGDASGSSPMAEAQALIAKYSAATTSYPSVPPVTGGAGQLRGKTVWFVPIGAAVPSLALYGDAMADALSKVGAKVHACDGKFLPTSITACLDLASTSGADLVVTAYVDYQLVPNAINGLTAKGIPVLMAGTVPPAGKESTPKLAFDDTTATQDLMERIISSAVIVDSGGKANVLYIGVTDSPNVREVGDHAVQFLKSNCPGCTVTRIDYNTAAIPKLASLVSAALIQTPGVDYVLTQVDPATAPAVSGAQSAGKANSIKFASTGGGLSALQDIKAGGHQFAELGTPSVYFGWRLADDAIRMAAGGVPSSDAYSLRLFTKDNVRDLDLSVEAFGTQAWYGDNSFEKTFLTAWGIT